MIVRLSSALPILLQPLNELCLISLTPFGTLTVPPIPPPQHINCSPFLFNKNCPFAEKNLFSASTVNVDTGCPENAASPM